MLEQGFAPFPKHVITHFIPVIYFVFIISDRNRLLRNLINSKNITLCKLINYLTLYFGYIT
jgi:hypothetical protein